MFNVALSSSLKFQGIALGRSRLFEVKHVANVIWLMTSSMPFLNTNRESISRGAICYVYLDHLLDLESSISLRVIAKGTTPSYSGITAII